MVSSDGFRYEGRLEECRQTDAETIPEQNSSYILYPEHAVRCRRRAEPLLFTIGEDERRVRTVRHMHHETHYVNACALKKTGHAREKFYAKRPRRLQNTQGASSPSWELLGARKFNAGRDFIRSCPKKKLNVR